MSIDSEIESRRAAPSSALRLPLRRTPVRGRRGPAEGIVPAQAPPVCPADEIAACVEAAHARCLRLVSDRPVVVIPAYHGTRRQPNLTALLAMGLARDGARVLVHGVAHDRARTTCAEVLHDLGLPVCRDAVDVDSLWARRAPAFVDLAALCPPLHALLAPDTPPAERQAARVLATLLAPIHGAPALRLIGAPPGVRAMIESWLQRSSESAVLLHGARGDPVCDPWRADRLDVMLGGLPRLELAVTGREPPVDRPLLPRTHDAPSTAVYVLGVLSGEKPMPDMLARQVALVQQALGALAVSATAGAAG